MKFTKMHGLGNDYIYVNCLEDSSLVENASEISKVVSNRHFGIGSDGLILICKSDIADFKMRMYNADGSEAEMCGNGIRCVGKFAYDKGLTDKEEVSIETLAGIKILKLNIKDDFVETVRVDMGEPIFNPELIPVVSNDNPVINLNLETKDRNFTFSCVSMGNPHAITFIDEDIKKFDIEKYGPSFETDSHFPKKTNVEFIQIVDKNNIKMRVWERGTGETLACGTGACASAVASIINKYTERNVNVELLGGTLNIEWSEIDNHVYMTGPATTVFEGEIML